MTDALAIVATLLVVSFLLNLVLGALLLVMGEAGEEKDSVLNLYKAERDKLSEELLRVRALAKEICDGKRTDG